MVSAPGTAVSAPAGSRARAITRLADNGLSASASSTATSSPDSSNKLLANQQQISSRMDNFEQRSSSSSQQFGGRYASTKPTTSSHQAHSLLTHQPQPIRQNNLINKNAAKYQRRSGHLASQKGANKQFYQTQQAVSSSQPMYTSASTTSISHQKQQTVIY